jgi:hypothetical protein
MAELALKCQQLLLRPHSSVICSSSSSNIMLARSRLGLAAPPLVPRPPRIRQPSAAAAAAAAAEEVIAAAAATSCWGFAPPQAPHPRQTRQPSAAQQQAWQQGWQQHRNREHCWLTLLSCLHSEALNQHLCTPHSSAICSSSSNGSNVMWHIAGGPWCASLVEQGASHSRPTLVAVPHLPQRQQFGE